MICLYFKEIFVNKKNLHIPTHLPLPVALTAHAYPDSPLASVSFCPSDFLQYLCIASLLVMTSLGLCMS